MQGLPNEEKAEMFCLFETALKVVTAEDIGNLKQFVDEIACKFCYCSNCTLHIYSIIRNTST